jgi:branched-chain amino acid transport system permease protein
MWLVAELVLRGMAIGSMYALIGLSFNLIYASTNVLNFAQGEILVVGAVLGMVFHRLGGLPLPMALLAVVVVMIVLGKIQERIVMPPLRKRPQSVTWLLATVGVGLVLRSLIEVTVGAQTMSLPALVPRVTITLGRTNLPLVYVFIVAVAVGVTASMERFYRRHLWGKAMVAVSQDASAGALRGINVKRVQALSFVMATVLGGVAGFVIAPVTFVQAAMGLSFVLKGFVAMTFGGLGKSWGTLAGGLLLGALEVLGVYFTNAAFQDSFAFGLLLLILMVRPRGLAGGRDVVRQV